MSNIAVPEDWLLDVEVPMVYFDPVDGLSAKPLRDCTGRELYVGMQILHPLNDGRPFDEVVRGLVYDMGTMTAVEFGEFLAAENMIGDEDDADVNSDQADADAYRLAQAQKLIGEHEANREASK